ncbi:MAG: response regulator [Planctomycetota bacterium]
MGGGRKLNILVADDLRRNQNALVGPLRRRGHRVERASTGREALHRVFESDFDLVILDVRMPVMDGFQAAKEIRSREAHLKRPLAILGVASALRPEDGRRALAAGMDAVVLKPVTTRSLIHEIKLLEEKLALEANESWQSTRETTSELPSRGPVAGRPFGAREDAPRRDGHLPAPPLDNTNIDGGILDADIRQDPEKDALPVQEEDADSDLGMEDTQLLEVPQATEPVAQARMPESPAFTEDPDEDDDTQFLDVPEPSLEDRVTPPSSVEEPSTTAVSVGDLEAVWEEVVSAVPVPPAAPAPLPPAPLPVKPQEPQAIDVLLQGDLPRTAPKKGFTIIRSDKSQEDFKPQE